MAVTLLAAVVAVGGAAAATPLHLGETPFILPRTLFMLLLPHCSFSIFLFLNVLLLFALVNSLTEV